VRARTFAVIHLRVCVHARACSARRARVCKRSARRIMCAVVLPRGGLGFRFWVYVLGGTSCSGGGVLVGVGAELEENKDHLMVRGVVLKRHLHGRDAHIAAVRVIALCAKHASERYRAPLREEDGGRAVIQNI
jgi:hypothetical protein